MILIYVHITSREVELQKVFHPDLIHTFARPPAKGDDILLGQGVCGSVHACLLDLHGNMDVHTTCYAKVSEDTVERMRADGWDEATNRDNPEDSDKNPEQITPAHVSKMRHALEVSRAFLAGVYDADNKLHGPMHGYYDGSLVTQREVLDLINDSRSP